MNWQSISGHTEHKNSTARLVFPFQFHGESVFTGRMPNRETHSCGTNKLKNTHPFHCQCSDSQHGSPADSQNQSGIRQQEVNHHRDAILSSPPVALEVHGSLFVVSLGKREGKNLTGQKENTGHPCRVEGK